MSVLCWGLVAEMGALLLSSSLLHTEAHVLSVCVAKCARGLFGKLRQGPPGTCRAPLSGSNGKRWSHQENTSDAARDLQ